MKFYTALQARLNALRTEDDGATAVEYGLMVALIAVAIMVTVGLLGTELDTLFEGVRQELVAVP